MKAAKLSLMIGLFSFMLVSCTLPESVISPVSQTVLPSPEATRSGKTEFPVETPITPIPSPAATSAPALSYIVSTATLLPPVPTIVTETPVRFAVIGDYGLAGQAESDVAELVLSWAPDFIITTGDNNYPSGSSDTIDTNIGAYYHTYIYPYLGVAGIGAEINRFFPTLGNHDWTTDQAGAYLEYFSLPGNERYYDFTWGPVHLFALDSDSHEPDGVGSSSVQAKWLRSELDASTASWKIVYMHHPPYSSAQHGSVEWMRWPFKKWGATAVLAGHDHTYERLTVDGLPYFVNGLGGGLVYNFLQIMDGSQVRFNADHGAMLVEATQNQIQFQFVTRAGDVIDAVTLVIPADPPGD